MNAAKILDEDQAALWNGSAGHAWVESQELMDRVLEPFERVLTDALRARPARRLLDVGCGTGATTLAAARVLGAEARSVGVDVSEPMIELARARAERERLPATFVCADAQRHAFEPAVFDTITSRFGVMFFDDFVEAFANLRRAAAPGAELRLVAWRGAEENAFMTVAERAAAPLLPSVPPRRPDAPGQFAFADAARVARFVERGGWSRIDIRPVDAVCEFPERELVRYFSRFGPVGRVLAQADEPTRDRVVATVRRAFDPFVHGEQVRFDAACWLIGARAGEG